MEFPSRYRLAAGWMLLGLCVLSVHAAGPAVMIGPADPIVIDQPRVAVEVYTPFPEQSYGPDFANGFLLDTGAQSIMAVGAAVDEMTSLGYQTADGVKFDELGIGGTHPYDVSEVYNVNYAGSDGAPLTLADVRLMSDSTVDFGGFGGIVGMPAMLGRVTTLDMTAMLGGPLGIDYMGVGFDAARPAGNGHRYSVPLELADFPPGGQRQAEDPLPTYAPLPLINVELRHSTGSATAPFVLDTGAQFSLISTAAAAAAGLDTNGNGVIDDEEAVGALTLNGVGGAVTVPMVGVDRLVLSTDQGVELIWTELEMAVYDIDPAIGGIFGCELLTTGWFAGVLQTGEYGAFEQVHFDFTDSDNLNGHMLLDMNPLYDNVVPALVPGDADGDGDVDLVDFIALKTNFNTNGATREQGDFDFDGDVDLNDFIILKNNFTGGAPVPEPATATLALLGGAGLASRRRRR